MSDNKNMLKIILALAWPTVLEGFLQTFVSYADSAMVGRLGADAMAKVGMSTPLTWLINSVLMAVGVGFMSYIARKSGAGEYDKMRSAAAQAVSVSIIIGSIVGLIAIGVSRSLPRWMGLEEKLWRGASLYFLAISIPMIFRALMIQLGAVLRASGNTKLPLKVNIIMNALNLILNVLFIYPTKTVVILGLNIKIIGFNYGAVGAGIGTGVSYIIGGILMLYALRSSKKISPIGESYRLNMEILKPCFIVGIPVALQSIISCLGHIVFASMVTALGTVAFAAHSIALTAEQAFYIPGFGMQAAAATLSGNMAGAKDMDGMKRLTKTFLLLIIAVMAVSGAALFIFAPQVMSFFTKDQEVIKLGVKVLRLVSLSEPIFGMGIIMEGIFSGVGDTKKPFIYSALSMWGVRIFGTYISINKLGLGLSAVWICMILNNVSRGILLGIHYKKGNWNPIKKTSH